MISTAQQNERVRVRARLVEMYNEIQNEMFEKGPAAANIVAINRVVEAHVIQLEILTVALDRADFPTHTKG